MATQENNPGLLSKVARFVRNPTKDWADLDKPDSILDGDHGREALKLVIERKRHDDAVRKREFAQLRKLRQASPSVKAELAQGLSSFRSTSGGVDDADVKERASTLKKIDDIEAQMSRQWWKGRSGAVPLAPSGSVGSAPSSQDDFPSTQSSRLSSTAQGEVTQMSGSAAFDYRPTEAGEVRTPDDDYDALPARRELPPARVVSADLGQNLSDPDMEEAAIRYANGDAAGAEAALQTALQLPDAKPEMVEAWAAALLDLYRSTGQSANFERTALNYARRFGRPAPAWAVVETSTRAPASGQSPPAPARSGQRWESPVVLDEAAVARLRAMVRPTGGTYYLNWRPVQRMTAAAASNLADLLAAWCELPLALCFEGVDSLERLLSALTPSGDRLVPSYYWQLRFDALRVLHRQDDYDMVALDFCVTFEVSPPTWREPVCQRVEQPQADLPTVPDRLASAPPPDTSAATALAAGGSELALSGDVLGDVSVILAQWQAVAGDASQLRVSCKRLIRVDFAAAGGLLNWATHVSAQGGRVEFVEVPRLVCAFFNLIGINEHAQVTARTN